MTYSFSVQLFFFISGFLFHTEKENKVFWRKNIILLVVPYFIWGTIRLITYNIKKHNFQTLCYSFTGLALGCNNFMGVRGCGELWFVVTLFCLKIFSQYVEINRKRLCILVAMSILFAIGYRNMISSTDLEYYGIGFFDSFVAFPFFAIGLSLSWIKGKVCVWVEWLHGHFAFLCMTTLVVLILLFMLAEINGVVYVVYGQYGSNMLAYILLGTIGIVDVFFMSIIMSKFSRISKYAKTINVGSIMILGLHTLLVNKGKTLLEILFSENTFIFESSLALVALLILITFVPMIKITQKYIPLTIGNRK